MINLSLYEHTIEFDESKEYYSINFSFNKKFNHVSPKYSITASSLRYLSQKSDKDKFKENTKRQLLNIENLLNNGFFKTANKTIRLVDDDYIDNTEKYKNAHDLLSRILDVLER